MRLAGWGIELERCKRRKKSQKSCATARVIGVGDQDRCTRLFERSETQQSQKKNRETFDQKISAEGQAFVGP